MNSSFKYFFYVVLLLVVETTWAVDTIDVSSEKGTLLLTEKHGGDGSAWGKSKCSACHFKNRIHQNAPKIKGIVKSVGFNSCTGCHGQNGTNTPRLCIVCHNEKRLPSAPIQQGTEAHNFDVTSSHSLTDEDCLACHHSSDMDGQFEPGTDLSYYQPESIITEGIPYKSGVEFCLRCHNETHQQAGYEMQARFNRDPLIKIEQSYTFLDMHGYPKGSGARTYAGLREGYKYGQLVECTDCHAMHGTHNTKLIVDRSDAGMSLLSPAIRKLPVLIHVENGNYAELCVTCHAMDTLVENGQDDAGNGLTGVHQVSGDCRECHVHGLAAQTGL